MYFDTMLAAYECFGDWDFWNLAAVSKKLLGVTIKRYKEIVGKGETFLDRPFAELVDHACCDADMALRLYFVLSRELRKRLIDQNFIDGTMQLENFLLDCELTGVRLDTERMTAISETLKMNTDLLKSLSFSLAGCDFDIDSYKSTTEILKKLRIWEKTTGQINEVQLEELACSHPLPFHIVKYRRERNRYKEAELLRTSAKDGRVFPKFSQIKSSHGSLWSGSPSLREALVGKAI
jgi:DNA polymerase-1